MKFNRIHEKTTMLPVDKQFVQVSNMSQEFKNEVETYDRLCQAKLDAIFELEKVELAIIVKYQQITAFAAQAVENARKEQAAQQAVAAVDSEVKKELGKLDEPKKAKTK